MTSIFDRNKLWAVSYHYRRVKRFVARYKDLNHKIEIVRPCFKDGKSVVFLYAPYFFVGCSDMDAVEKMRKVLLKDGSKNVVLLTDSELRGMEEVCRRVCASKKIDLEREEEDIPLKTGDRIQVERGNFQGYRGYIVGKVRKRFKVKLDDFSMVFYFPANMLRQEEV